MKKVRLCLVADSDTIAKKANNSLEAIVRQAVEGRVDMIQLRCKNDDTRNFIDKAFLLKKILRPNRIPLIINDRVDVALAVHADGVHLGTKDMPFEVAKPLLYRQLGRKCIIGLSVDNPTNTNIKNLNKLRGVSYLGVGAIYPTQSKDVNSIWGIEALKKFRLQCNHHLMAIGGIDQTNVTSLWQAGVNSVAVISAICLAPNVKQATSLLRENFSSYKK